MRLCSNSGPTPHRLLHPSGKNTQSRPYGRVCKAALICNHQHHWKLQILDSHHLMSHCFAVLRLEGRARGAKLERASKSSCGLAIEGNNPSNSTKQRLPTCIYLFFLPLNIYIYALAAALSFEFIVCWIPSVFGITKFATV